MAAAPDARTTESDPVDTDELIREAIDSHRAAAIQKGIELSLQHLSAPLPILEGNELLLRRALNVLIDNAICHTPPGGHVIIGATVMARSIEISVKDNGPGIAEEHRSHIFERFYRVDKSRADHTHSGLGLCIAKQIIADHGG